MKPALRVPAPGLAVGSVALDVESCRYVLKVHRVREGDEVWLFDPEAGVEGRGRVVIARPGEVILDVPEVGRAPPQGLDVRLLQALGKGDKPEQAIRDATVLGASRVVLLETDRTIVRSTGDRTKRHRKVAVEAARQSGRGDLPELVGPLAFDEAMAAESATRKLLFAWHPESQPLLGRLRDWTPLESLALLIGPEGGLSPTEVELARAHGFAPTSLGPLVLRTETAATVALGIVRARSQV